MFSRLARRLATVLALVALAGMPASAQVASWLVKDRSLSAPPGSPAQGDRYIVGPSPTSAWAGHANDIAVRQGTAWKFITAQEGLSAWVADEPAKVIYYNGTTWGDVPLTVNVNPAIPTVMVGNGAPNVLGAIVSQGETTSHVGSQIQALFGLISKHGFGLGNDGNNVALYSGIETWNGSGNTWAFNLVQRLMPGLAAATPGQAFQGFELDIQNDAQDFGVGEIIGPGPWVTGLTITGSTQQSRNGGVPYLNNAALYISGGSGHTPPNPIWNYGIVFNNVGVKQATIYDSSKSITSFSIAGQHTWGIDLLGTFSSAGIRGANNIPLIGARNAANSADLGLLKLDASDRLILGAGVSTTLLNQGAANYWQLEGGTTGNPTRLLSQGSDTDVALHILSKGVGIVVVGNSTGFNFQINSPVGTQANRWAVAGALAGTSPGLSTVGSDTNINGIISLKGSALLAIGNTNGLFAQLADGSLDLLKAGSVLKIAGTQVVGPRNTGWAADTGTAKKTANATYSGTAEAGYTQATIQALMDAVRDTTQTQKSIKDALILHGLIGP